MREVDTTVEDITEYTHAGDLSVNTLLWPSSTSIETPEPIDPPHDSDGCTLAELLRFGVSMDMLDERKAEEHIRLGTSPRRYTDWRGQWHQGASLAAIYEAKVALDRIIAEAEAEKPRRFRSKLVRGSA